MADIHNSTISGSILAAAHELKAPLSLIRQLSLELQQVSADEVDYHKLIEQIFLTSERSIDLVSSLTRTARLEDSLFATEALNPAAVCAEVAHELSPLFKAQQRRIEVSDRSRPGRVVANRELLGGVLRQFASNALSYSDDSRPVVLSINSRQSKTRISVRDWGPAVPVTIQKQLGTSLQPLSSRPQSSGLGLYIARQFADAMQAEVGVTRHRDGASFYIDTITSRQLQLSM